MPSAEVWGDPIDHSLSPVLHRAAYAHLGWDWTYERRRVDEAGFVAALDARAPGIRGLSLTFPLKTAAHRSAARLDRRATLTGAVNTLVFPDDGPAGFNTDVGGIVADLRAHELSGVDAARIVGAGATATSALAALAELGAGRVEVLSRRPADALVALGERLGVAVHNHELAAPPAGPAPLTISTLPGGADIAVETADALAAAGGTLYDVVYGHWPTVLASAWLRAGGTAVGGLGMLLHQAVLQIRIFATGDVDAPLPDEPGVVDVMGRALMGD